MNDSSKVRRIGLYGPFGWGNLGDASIQEAMMHNVRLRLPHVEFLGVSLRPDNTEKIHGIASFPIQRTWSPSSSRGRQDARTANATSATSRGLGTRSRAASNWKSRVGAIPILGPVLRKTRGLARPFLEVLRELRFIGRSIEFLRSLDLFVLSGGGQLSDDWGGPWEHPYSILKWTLCARLAGRRVYVVSVGAGPFLRSPTSLLLRTAMRFAHYRSYRDQRSHDLVAPWGFTRRDPVYPDLAFSLPLMPQARPERGLAFGLGAELAPGASGTPSAVDERPLVLGISPMSYCLPRAGAWPVQDIQRYERYRRMMLEFTTHVLQQGHAVVLLCTQIGSDCQAVDDLVQDLQDSGKVADGERLRMVPTRNLPHLLEQIASIDIIVTSRLHGVILSFLQHKPAIALSYDPKIQSVMEQFGQSMYCLEIGEATTEKLLARLQTLRGELSLAREGISRVAIANRAKLEEQYDRLFGPPREMPREEQIPATSLTGRR